MLGKLKLLFKNEVLINYGFPLLHVIGNSIFKFYGVGKIIGEFPINYV